MSWLLGDAPSAIIAGVGLWRFESCSTCMFACSRLLTPSAAAAPTPSAVVESVHGRVSARCRPATLVAAPQQRTCICIDTVCGGCTDTVCSGCTDTLCGGCTDTLCSG